MTRLALMNLHLQCRSCKAGSPIGTRQHLVIRRIAKDSTKSFCLLCPLSITLLGVLNSLVCLQAHRTPLHNNWTQALRSLLPWLLNCKNRMQLSGLVSLLCKQWCKTAQLAASGRHQLTCFLACRLFGFLCWYLNISLDFNLQIPFTFAPLKPNHLSITFVLLLWDNAWHCCAPGQI